MNLHMVIEWQQRSSLNRPAPFVVLRPGWMGGGGIGRG